MTTPLADLAERQHGVVSREQLRTLGFSDDAVDRAVRAGRLHRVHRGVYAVGHPLVGPHGRWWAAILACGEGAVLSHRAASSVWDFWPSAKQAIDVIAPRRIRQPGIHAHRHRLHPDDRTAEHDLPVTTVERTLIDLATVLRPRQLEQAYDRARINRRLDYAALHAGLRRRATPALQAILDADRPAALTGSELERGFLDLVRAAGLPEPDTNAYPSGHQVDFRWTTHRLLVEVDGHGAHGARRARRRDSRRDAEHLVAGWRTVRFTYEDVMHDPAYVVATLRALLRGSPAP